MRAVLYLPNQPMTNIMSKISRKELTLTKENGDRIHPFSTSESIKNALESHVTFSLEFYEVVHKGIEANERSRIQIALGDYFYPLALGSLIELDGQKYIVVQMNGCANSDAETLDIEAILYEENKPVLPLPLLSAPSVRPKHSGLSSRTIRIP